MPFRGVLAAAAFAAGLVAAAGADAATITSNFTTWSAAVGSYATTTSTGLPLYSNVTTIPLADGHSLSVAGPADTLLQPLNGWGPWSDGYSGDIVDTTTNSETISFASGITALGMQVDPDFGLFGPYGETFTVTLSDGTTTQISGSYPSGTTQFIGFYGRGITSITIAATNAPDFAFGNIVDAVAVPEPMSFSLLAAGLTALAFIRRKAS